MRITHQRPVFIGVVLLSAVIHSSAHADVVINEVLASNRFTILDDDGNSSDWIEILNSGEAPVDLDGYGLTDDGTLPLKWVFPKVLLQPNEPLVVWCSGDDRVVPAEAFIKSPEAAPLFRPTLFSLDAEWAYLAEPPSDRAPPADWKDLEFDDAAWPRGKPGFGYGDDDDTTVISEDVNVVFLRHRFEVRDPDDVVSLVLSIDQDDGFGFFLNGELLASYGFPEDEEVTFGSRATRSHEAGREPERFDLSEHRSLLRAGTNVAAIVLLNRSTSGGDLSLFPELGSVPPVLHTNFELNRDGEQLGLTAPDGEVLDVVILGQQTEDRSYGRYPDGDGAFHYMLVPSPAAANDSRIASVPISRYLDVQPAPGKYDREIQVAIDAAVPFDGFEIRYTTDGSSPRGGTVYDGRIVVSRDTVIRCAGYLDDEPVTPVVSKSYFTSSRALRMSLPILSISMPQNQFVFVHSNNDGRGRAYEREAYMEIFTPDGELATDLGFGLRLHGGAGRGGGLSTKKSYKAYFRGEYGRKKLRYPLIEDTDVESFDKLVLRANFNDAFRTGSAAALIRDQVIRDVHEDMGATVSHGTWYNLFVNMRYYGIFNIVERMDKDFFASYFPEDGDRWDVMKTGDSVLDGTSRHWTAVRTFLLQNDLTVEESYRVAQEMIDVENFTSYMLVNMWAQNHDWPQNNWYAARPQRDDGRWIYLSWDAEFGLGLSPGGFAANTFQHVKSQAGTMFSLVLRSLLRNENYKNYFLDELDRHLRGALAPENVEAHVDRLKDLIEPDIPFEVTVSGGNVLQWRNNVNTVRRFAANRNPVFRRFVASAPEFGLPVVNSVRPPQVTFTEASAELAFGGARFTTRTTVEFGDGVPAVSVQYLSPTLLNVVVPADVSLEGRPEIHISDGDRTYTAAGLLTLRFRRPKILAMVPERGSARGGDTVTIQGENFQPGVRVEFAGVPSPQVDRVSEEVLLVVTPPGMGSVDVLAVNTDPAEIPAEEFASFLYEVGEDPLFRRGDANGDGRLNLLDAIAMFGYLHDDVAVVACEDAFDIDDSGTLDLTDPVVLLNYLFQPPSAPPAEPFRSCGVDVTEDLLGCAQGALNSCGV